MRPMVTKKMSIARGFHVEVGTNRLTTPALYWASVMFRSAVKPAVNDREVISEIVMHQLHSRLLTNTSKT